MKERIYLDMMLDVIEIKCCTPTSDTQNQSLMYNCSHYLFNDICCWSPHLSDIGEWSASTLALAALSKLVLPPLLVGSEMTLCFSDYFEPEKSLHV
jgi:hypothetical protein